MSPWRDFLSKTVNGTDIASWWVKAASESEGPARQPRPARAEVDGR